MIDKTVNKEKIINAPVPESTDTYEAVPNDSIINTIGNRLLEDGYKIEGTQYQANKNLTQFFGCFFLKGSQSDIGTTLAWVNSYDKTKRFSLASGTKVYMCSNLDFADHKVLRKHTSNFWNDFYKLIDEAINSINVSYEEILAQYDKMKQTSLLGDDKIGELIGKLFYNEELINSQQLNKLKSNLSSQNLFGRETYYDFHMHLTDTLKSSRPTEFIENHKKAREFILEEINV